MQKTKGGLVQINSEFDNKVYLPLVAGYLHGYLLENSKFKNDLELGPIIFKRMPIGESVQRLIDCDFVAFSIYVWNEQVSLRIAREYKEARNRQGKRSLVVIGGPQVPDFAEEFFAQNPFVDIVVHNEGEEAFVEIIDKYIAHQEILDVQNTSVFRNGAVVKVPNRKRIINLDSIPSPFLNGIFDELVTKSEAHSFLVLWESNRGCPFQCTFCDWGSATAAKVNQFSLDRLKKELEWIAKNEIEFVFVCDANFGILPRDIEIAETVVSLKNAYGYPHAFSVQSTKNLKERAFQVQKILSDAALSKGVTLSMQSLSTTTLELIRRENISLDSYHELQDRFSSNGVLTYSDLILGLPGESLESWKRGISTLINNGQHNRIQFNNLSLLPNAEMSNTLERKKHMFETIKSEIVNVHGKGIDDFGEVKEWQELVIGSRYMPKQDWVVARTYAYWVALLYFDKLATLPIVMASKILNREIGDVLQDLINEIEGVSAKEYPILSDIRNGFQEQALAIQSGKIEYQRNPEWLDVYWPADEYALIELVAGNALSEFYEEIQRLVEDLLKSQSSEKVTTNIETITQLNFKLLRLPNEKDSILEISSDDQKLLADIARIQFPNIEQSRIQIHTRIVKEDFGFKKWLREVVWYGHRSGKYVAKWFSVIDQNRQDNHREISGHNV